MRDLISPVQGYPSPFGAVSGLFASYKAGGIPAGFVADFTRERYKQDGSDDAAVFTDLFTFSRSSVANYRDGNGNLVSVASGEPRIGHHVNSVNEGLLLERKAATNIVSAPTDFLNVAWNQISIDTPTQDGDGWWLLQDSAGGTGWVSQGSLSVTAGQYYTFAIDAKAGTSTFAKVKIRASGNTPIRSLATSVSSGGATITNSDGDTAFDTFNTETMVLATGEYRLVFTVLIPTGYSSLEVLLYPSHNNSIGTNSSYRYPQLESGRIASSFIDGTRAAETILAKSAALPFNATAISMQMKGRLSYADEDTEDQIGFVDWDFDASNYIRVTLDTDGSMTGEFNFEQAQA